MNTTRLLALCALLSALAGCSSFDRLKTVGEAPVLTAINDPTAQAGYKPINMPMPTGRKRVSRSHSAEVPKVATTSPSRTKS